MSENPSTKKKNFKQNIVDLYSSMVNILPNNSNIFIYNSGFNLFDEQKINLMFGQIPRMYPIKYEFNYSNFNENLRKKFNFEKFFEYYINLYLYLLLRILIDLLNFLAN